jgi:hypothetical protein
MDEKRDKVIAELQRLQEEAGPAVDLLESEEVKQMRENKQLTLANVQQKFNVCISSTISSSGLFFLHGGLHGSHFFRSQRLSLRSGFLPAGAQMMFHFEFQRECDTNLFVLMCLDQFPPIRIDLRFYSDLP